MKIINWTFDYWNSREFLCNCVSMHETSNAQNMFATTWHDQLHVTSRNLFANCHVSFVKRITAINRLVAPNKHRDIHTSFYFLSILFYYFCFRSIIIWLCLFGIPLKIWVKMADRSKRLESLRRKQKYKEILERGNVAAEQSEGHSAVENLNIVESLLIDSNKLISEGCAADRIGYTTEVLMDVQVTIPTNSWFSP